MRHTTLLFAAALLLAGCGPAAERAAETESGATGEKTEVKDKVIFDVESGLTFKNHVAAVEDPAGEEGRVFVTSDREKKMTFVNGGGFFTVPAGHKGSLKLRLFSTAELALKIAVVGEEKHRSYNRKVPAAGKWFDLVLPLADLAGKVAEGEKVKDVTVWLKPLEEGGKVPADARLYCARAVFSGR